MKTIAVFCLLVIIAKGTFASHKFLDSKQKGSRTEVLCGETDSIIMLMDPSLLYLNKATVEIKSATKLSINGFFWNTSSYVLPTNGDLAVSITKINVLRILLPMFVLSLLIFIPAYFLSSRSPWQERGVTAAIMLGCMSIIVPGIDLFDNFEGGGFFVLLFFLPFLLAWGTTWLSKMIYKKYSDSFFQFIKKLKKRKLAL